MSIVYISHYPTLFSNDYKDNTINSSVSFDTQLLELLSFVSNKKIFYYCFNNDIRKYTTYNFDYFNNNIKVLSKKQIQKKHFDILITNDDDIFKSYDNISLKIYYNPALKDEFFVQNSIIINNINTLLGIVKNG